jgi:4-hydroxy-3-polyprenylbenzoate decarboxylase
VTDQVESGPAGPKLKLTLAVTGASGSIFAAEMLRALDADGRVAKVDFIVSEAALRVFAEEMQVSGRNGLVEKLLGGTGSGKIAQHPEADIGANVASGSYHSDGMIVLPCTMGTLAGIAHGMASNLIERAADVCLKEGRRLVLCVRESPFNKIHLRNMQLAADAGATIFPVMPALYNLPQSTEEMARQFVDRVLAHVGLPQAGAFEWKGEALRAVLDASREGKGKS